MGEMVALLQSSVDVSVIFWLRDFVYSVTFWADSSLWIYYFTLKL